MSDLAIRVEGIGKRYRIGLEEEKAETLVGAMTQIVKAPLKSYRYLRKLSTFEEDEAEDIVWALRDVSFEVRQGEAVGLIGRNGAGKSTLLKVLSRITDPTEGYIDLYGRVASLLEVGTGFHPELTGRENVYLNGTLLGMKKEEVDRKFDEIVDFSGVEKYIDTPVKRYSSGMKVRLAFAVAAHLEPEILLVDEVLAVGDVAFQKKCLGKMDDVAGEGRTVIFVSHHMSMIQALCTRGVVMSGGQIEYDGPVDAAIAAYLRQMEDTADDPFGDNPERGGNGPIRLTGVRILDETGSVTESLIAGADATIELDYDNPTGLNQARFKMSFYNSLGVCVVNLDSGITANSLLLQRRGTVRCVIPRLPLQLGLYRIAAAVSTQQDVTSDHVPAVATCEVSTSKFYASGKTPPSKHSLFMMDYEWSAVSTGTSTFSHVQGV